MASLLVSNATDQLVTPSTEPAASGVPQLGTPAYLQWGYDLTWLSGTKGAGDTVAIIDAYDDPYAESDLQTYRSAFGLPTCDATNGCFTEVNQSGQASPLPGTTDPYGWNVEESLDLDAVSALCPNCKILYIEANSASGSDLQAAAATAASMGANQISMSFGSDSPTDPDGPWSFSGSASFAASGDNGYVGSGQGSFPASDPGVNAVGGTSVSLDGNARGFAESAWSGGGAGCAVYVTRPSWQTGSCGGRAFSDVSADASPSTGLAIYDSTMGSPSGWAIVGGTSLATPLTAAFAALTGVASAGTPQWSYTDAAHLNDITSGSDGSCGIYYICHAGSGYDGPTGNGSISGAVVTGGPGIGGEYTSGKNAAGTSINLDGGIYPNGSDTSYHWEYGTSSAYGQSTAAQDAGAGSALVSVSATLSGLTVGQTYHFRLVATNSDGTVYGYDQTFTPTASPQNTAPPSVSSPGGPYQQGQPLSASAGTWNPTGTPSYQWRRCTGAGGSGASLVGIGCSNISGATWNAYLPTAADVDHYIVVTVTERNAGGSTTATSAPVGRIAASPRSTPPPRPRILRLPVLRIVRGQLGLIGGRYRDGTPRVIRYYRCARFCRLIGIRQAGRPLRPTTADLGFFIRARVKLTGPGGTTWTRLTAPALLLSARTGAAAINTHRHHSRVRVRSVNRASLASVTAVRRGWRAMVLTVHAQRRRPITVWACVLRGARVLGCARHRDTRATVRFSVRAAAGDTLEVVAMRPLPSQHVARPARRRRAARVNRPRLRRA